MTPETRTKWLAALRSGEYPKTKKHLKDDCGYCCLGVLLEVAGPGFTNTRMDGEWYEPEDLQVGERSRTMYRGNELSGFALEHFGLGQGQHDALTELNDNSETFAGVIEYIEQQYLGQNEPAEVQG